MPTARALQVNTPIFSEPPFLVAGSQMRTSEAAAENDRVRWQAYLALERNVSLEKSTGKYSKAMKAFGERAAMHRTVYALPPPPALCIHCQPAAIAAGELSVGNHLPVAVRSGAEAIVARHFAAAATPLSSKYSDM